jgi:hypothetical protein
MLSCSCIFVHVRFQYLCFKKLFFLFPLFSLVGRLTTIWRSRNVMTDELCSARHLEGNNRGLTVILGVCDLMRFYSSCVIDPLLGNRE